MMPIHNPEIFLDGKIDNLVYNVSEACTCVCRASMALSSSSRHNSYNPDCMVINKCKMALHLSVKTVKIITIYMKAVFLEQSDAKKRRLYFD